MILLVIGTVALIVVIGIALYLNRRVGRNHPDRPRSHRAGAGRHAAPADRGESEDEYYGEAGEEDDPTFFAAMERPEGIATEPPEFLAAPTVDIPGYLTEPVEDLLPGYHPNEWTAPVAEVSHGEWLPPTLPPEPEPLLDGHASAPYCILPLSLAPGLAALSSLAGLIAPAAQAEAERQKAAAEAELLERNMADFPHLFSPDIEYSEWKWDTDSGILNVRELRKQLAAEPAPRERRVAA